MAIHTVENTVNAGFENISIDLIFSLPNQTQSTWKENLDIAVEPSNKSYFCLQFNS
jgi:oxygen-independent coproporphyrinogen-3 oxidase